MRHRPPPRNASSVASAHVLAEAAWVLAADRRSSARAMGILTIDTWLLSHDARVLATAGEYHPPMLNLHGFVMSPNTRRARWMLEECAAEYTFIDVDLMSAEHKGDAYRALNPTARVPTLVDGDFVLWESNAILEYLAAKAPAAHLGGEGPREIGEIARWMFMNAAHLSPNVARIFAHTVRLPPEKRIPQIVEEGRSEVDRSLAALDAALGGREYVAASRFTIADISIAPTLSAAPMLGIDLSRFPKVAAWYARVAARAAFKKVFS